MATVRQWLHTGGMVVMVLLVGCDLFAPSPQVTVNFSDAKGLQAGDPVELNGAPIGTVAAVELNPAGVSVQLKLEAGKANTVQQGAAAMIATEAPKRRVVVYNPAGQGAAIADGAALRGLNSEFEFTFWQTAGAITAAQKAFKQTAESLQNYFQSEEWRQIKKRMEDLLNSIPEQADAMAQGFREKFEALIRELELQSKQPWAQIEERYKAVLADLDKTQKEFHELGKPEIVASLQKLRDELEASVNRYREQSQLGVGKQ